MLQVAGRVIRSEQDRGIALLIDQRFSTYPYRGLLHREWHTIRVQEPGIVCPGYGAITTDKKMGCE